MVPFTMAIQGTTLFEWFVTIFTFEISMVFMNCINVNLEDISTWKLFATKSTFFSVLPSWTSLLCRFNLDSATNDFSHIAYSHLNILSVLWVFKCSFRLARVAKKLPQNSHFWVSNPLFLPFFESFCTFFFMWIFFKCLFSF